MASLFHLSLPCQSISATKTFYTKHIGASIGRHDDNWMDVNLFGHQITFTKAGKFDFNNPNYVFEGKILPSFHFGVIIDVKTWGEIYARLSDGDLEVVTQATFLKEQPGEHLSFFIKDPNGYMLEFKSFKKENEVFSS
ncbi:VOC family protein [Mangrovimonas aestuarii]|uniref:VOC family protein n=1 Tax=Mangrovimonas aestuarii TaxID=3018443 RepID=UPI002378E7E9|nr:VOC family protein [Mangrovimonas aestuarii]